MGTKQMYTSHFYKDTFLGYKYTYTYALKISSLDTKKLLIVSSVE